MFQTEVRVPEVPKALRSCKNAPTPPGAQKRTQKDVANYLVRLKDAHDDCQDKLDDVDDLLTQNENKAKDFNRQQQQQAK